MKKYTNTWMEKSLDLQEEINSLINQRKVILGLIIFCVISFFIFTTIILLGGLNG